MEHAGPPRRSRPSACCAASRWGSTDPGRSGHSQRGSRSPGPKPGNVLVTEVKLVDFGVAKWLEEQSQFTQVGVVGSYSTVAGADPQGGVDHRADTYGMGVLLYELLSRASGPGGHKVWLHCTAQPTPLSRRFVNFPRNRRPPAGDAPGARGPLTPWNRAQAPRASGGGRGVEAPAPS